MKTISLLLIVFLVINVAASLKVDSDNLHFENCLQNILSVEFTDDVILFYKTSRMNFRDFSSKTSIIVSNGITAIDDNKHRHSLNKLKAISYNQRISLVYFARSKSDVEILERILKTNGFYKGKFLIFFKRCVYDPKITRRILSIAYNHGVSHIALAIYTNESIIFRSWFPFDKVNRCGRRFHTKTFQICSGFYDSPTLYKNKLYNLQECRLKLTYVKSEPFVIDVESDTTPGLFVSLFDTIKNATGIKMEYEFHDRFQEEFLNRGTLTGLFDHLVREKSDVILGHLFMNFTSDNTIPGPQIESDDLVWVAPKPKRYVTTYRNIFKPFTIDLWLFHVVIFGLIIVFVSFLHFHYGYKLDTCHLIFNVLRIVFNMIAHCIPKRTTVRILMIFYSLYCIDMNAIYVGKLSSIFTIPKSSMTISDIELFYLNKIFVNISNHVNALTNLLAYVTNEDVGRELRILNWTDAELLKKVATTQTNGTLVFKSTAKTYTSEAAAVDWFVSHSRSLFLCYYLRNFNMINKPIVYWTREVIEKGLLRKWWMDIKYKYRNYTLLKTIDEDPIEVVVYSVHHYEQAYFMLIAGYILASIVFALEFFAKWIEKKIARMKAMSYF